VLYQYWEMIGTGAVIFTVLSFLRYDTEEHPGIIEPVGKVFFMYAAAILWLLFSAGTLSIHIRWLDGGELINFTYMPVNGEEYLALVPGTFGILMLIIAFAHTIEYFTVRPISEAMKELK